MSTASGDPVGNPRATTPIDRVIEIQEFFSVPENRGKFQYPIPESALRARRVIILLGRPDVGSLR